MSNHDEKVLDERCENCGTRLKQYPKTGPIGEITGHDIGCPNFFINDACPGVVCEVTK